MSMYNYIIPTNNCPIAASSRKSLLNELEWNAGQFAMR